MGAVRGHFAPEFVNRLDEFVVFEPLSRTEIAAIVQLQINRLNKRLGMAPTGHVVGDVVALGMGMHRVGAGAPHMDGGGGGGTCVRACVRVCCASLHALCQCCSCLNQGFMWISLNSDVRSFSPISHFSCCQPRSKDQTW